MLWLFVKWLGLTAIAVAGGWFEYKYRKKSKKMRIFDELSLELQNEIAITCIRYAKGEIEDLQLPASTDVIEYAVGFGEMWFIEESDFTGLDPENYESWVGPRPTHRPKTW